MLQIWKMGVVLTAFLLAWPAGGTANRPFDIDTYMALKQVSEIAVSPDGAYLAYTVSHYDLEKDG